MQNSQKGNYSFHKFVIMTLRLLFIVSATCLLFPLNNYYAQDVTAKSILQGLDMTKKNKLALGLKFDADYMKERSNLTKDNRNFTLFYDQGADYFNLFFVKGDQDNTAQISYYVEDNKVTGCHVDVYLSSSALSHQVMEEIESFLKKTYDPAGASQWYGKHKGRKFAIQFFDGASNGFSGFVFDISFIE